MNNDDYEEKLKIALDEIKNAPCDADLSSFEHEVWSEIAIRDNGSLPFFSRWFASGVTLPVPALAACWIFAMLVGSLFGISKAHAYDKEVSLEVERRYVESIHPVMMSSDHSRHSHR